MKIYKIENKINRKIYIGQTKREINKRIYYHLKRQSHIGNALRKYGLESFNISVIDHAPSEKEIDEKERYWIKFYNCRDPNGYNFTDGGDGLTNPSDETRRKMSATKRANPFYPSEESRKKMSIASLGRPKSEETKQKMRKPKSEEAKLNMKKAHERPEVKQKHRDAMIGNKNAFGNKISSEVLMKRILKLSGKNNGMYGKHHTDETKEKIRKTKLARIQKYEQFANSNFF